MSRKVSQPCTALAPGKLIISGEHAVVYGRPALVMAVDRHVTTSLDNHPAPAVRLDLPGLGVHEELPWDRVLALADRYDASYASFLAGATAIENVIDHPAGPAAYTLALLHRAGLYRNDDGVAVAMTSTIPAGCGMGSSAAATCSLLCAATTFRAQTFDPAGGYEQAMSVERLQHGRPSGVDPYVSLHGGFLRFRGGNREATLKTPETPLFLAQTGTPATGTGSCVMHVASRFEHSAIWHAFERVTLGLERALQTSDAAALLEGIRENHALLTRVGVVPERVCEFVAKVEAQGGAAKVCGAGAVSGDQAGAVLVAGPDTPARLCEEYGYPLMPVVIDGRGTRLSQP